MNDQPRYYANLPKNILLFSTILRKRKVGVTTDNVLDTLRGLSFVDLQRKQDFHDLLKANFVSNREESEIFEELFERFWSFGEPSAPSLRASLKEALEPQEGEGEEEAYEPHGQGPSSLLEWLEKREKETEEAEKEEFVRYSPEEILGQKDFSHFTSEELDRIRQWVLKLSRKMALTLSRRWKRGRTGDQLDFRKSIRQSLKYGGEILELRRREPKPKPLHLILLGDVSGSMDIYCQFFLLFMYGLQNHYPRTASFVFSTRLSHVTSLLKGRTFHEALALLSQKVVDWSGGTNIGAALHQFHHRYAHLLSARRACFFIFSDGWDRGDTELLDLEMKNLKRQVRRLIWLNPLLGSPSYQPLCKGMSTALPYLDHFLPCHNLESLKKIAPLITKG